MKVAQVAKGANNVQDEYSIEMRTAAANAAFLHTQVAAIFAAANAAERKRTRERIAAELAAEIKAELAAAGHTDEHSYDDDDRAMMRESQRADWAREERGF
jgi:DNA invertase Pin-like site-specific DNA recombinase